MLLNDIGKVNEKIGLNTPVYNNNLFEEITKERLKNILTEFKEIKT